VAARGAGAAAGDAGDRIPPAAQAHFRKTIMAKEKEPTEQERFAQTHPEGVFHP
jgi:hypothetical protein